MEAAGTPPQVVVLAITLKGEVNCAPFVGAVTVMANAGRLDTRRATRAEKRVLIRYSKSNGQAMLTSRTNRKVKTVAVLKMAQPWLRLSARAPEFYRYAKLGLQDMEQLACRLPRA